jgi:hypothetical protein
MELLGPGLMSRTMSVPAGLPLVRHSSAPRMPSSAPKKTVPPARVRLKGFEPTGPA